MAAAAAVDGLLGVNGTVELLVQAHKGGVLADLDAHWWGVPLEALLFLYCFVGLAIICDDYLVPSLEVLCVRWAVREDVAGASFMAFGSAAPEIIVNAISTFKAAGASPETINLGLGAIMGSSVIAFSLIPGCCALFCSRDAVALSVKRRPLVRDVVTYLAALVLLVSFYGDERIELAESASLLALYAVYLLVVFFAPKVRHHYNYTYLNKPLQQQESFVVRQASLNATASAAEAPPDDTSSLGPMYGSLGQMNQNGVAAQHAPDAEESDMLSSINGDAPSVGSVSGAEDCSPRSRLLPGRGPRARGPRSRGSSRARASRGYSVLLESLPSDDDGDEDPDEAWAIERLASGAAFPLKYLCSWTVPACELDSHSEWRYPFTLMISFVWVAAISFVISSIVEHWGHLTKVPLAFFGFFLVSLGAEVPDTVQSVTVARRGYGSMAVSNAIGSQICNICIGLGLPWTLSILGGHEVPVTDARHLLLASYLQFANIAVLASLLLLPVLVYGQDKAQLTKRKGAAMVTMYVAVVVTYATQSLR